MISDEELKNLTKLARIGVPEEEFEGLKKDIGSILDYVGQVQEVATNKVEVKSGALRNVMREDENPHKSGEYTKDLMNEAPETKDGYVKVKKIL